MYLSQSTQRRNGNKINGQERRKKQNDAPGMNGEDIVFPAQVHNTEQ
jgi:hypothetical protein